MIISQIKRNPGRPALFAAVYVGQNSRAEPLFDLFFHETSGPRPIGVNLTYPELEAWLAERMEPEDKLKIVALGDQVDMLNAATVKQHCVQRVQAVLGNKAPSTWPDRRSPG